MTAASLALISEQQVSLAEAVGAAGALQSAEQLGVLDRLANGPADAASLARDCSISRRGAGLLLAALAGLGLLEAEDHGIYRAALADLPSLGAIAARWRGLAEALRNDRQELALDIPAAAEPHYAHATIFLAAQFAGAAERAADQLSEPGQQVIDLGAGAAPWSRAIARRDPGCIVTAVDLPAVLEVTRREVAGAGLDTQFQYLPGDFFSLNLGRQLYDLAICAGVTHLFEEARNRRLLGRAFRALRPGGRLALLDAVTNERLDGPRSVVLYALGLITYTRAGRVYPFSAYAGWLRDAGYEAIERLELDANPPLSLITAHRPRA